MSEATGKLKEWAVLIYICGDVPEPGMHRAAEANLHQMLRAGSSSQVWVAAQIATPDLWSYRYIFPEREPGSGPISIKPAQSFATVNSSSPQAILDFFHWTASACPAKKIMLVLWGHGYGLDYYVPPEFGVEELPYLVKTARLAKASVARPTSGHDKTNLSNLDEEHGSFPDFHARSVLNNREVGDILRTIAKSLTKEQTLAIVGFDACAMALAEVWSELSDTASIGIASEAGLPYTSWPYDTFLQALHMNGTATAEEAAGMLLSAFESYYREHRTEYVTLSAIDLTAIKRFEQAVKLLTPALMKASADEGVRQNIFRAIKYCPVYDGQGFIDLGCFCEFAKITMTDSTVGKACDMVLSALKKLVVESTYSPEDPAKKISQSTGVSVWLPPWIQFADAYAIEKNLGEAYLTHGYSQTQFAKATGWGKFLICLRAKSWGLPEPGSKRI